MAPFCKEDKILIKSLYECKGYNARQFITEFPDKATRHIVSSFLNFTSSLFMLLFVQPLW